MRLVDLDVRAIHEASTWKVAWERAWNPLCRSLHGAARNGPCFYALRTKARRRGYTEALRKRATADRGEAMRIGFIGTGTMGTPIAGCLIAAGHDLAVYDVRNEATRTLAAQGATVAGTALAAVQEAEAVFICLPGPKEVEE